MLGQELWILHHKRMNYMTRIIWYICTISYSTFFILLFVFFCILYSRLGGHEVAKKKTDWRPTSKILFQYFWNITHTFSSISLQTEGLETGFIFKCKLTFLKVKLCTQLHVIVFYILADLLNMQSPIISVQKCLIIPLSHLAQYFQCWMAVPLQRFRLGSFSTLTQDVRDYNWVFP